MQQKPLEYYMALNYTTEVTYTGDQVYSAQIRELPECWITISGEENLDRLWQLLEEAKEKWLKRALQKKEWIPEPWTVEEDSWQGIHEDEDLREVLYWNGILRFPLPLLQDLWLRELGVVGLHQNQSRAQVMTETGSPNEPPTRAPMGEVRPVRLGKSERVVWLWYDGDRTRGGYKAIEVSDQLPKTQAAMISALTILEATDLDSRELERVHKLVELAFDARVRSRPAGSPQPTVQELWGELLPYWYENEHLHKLSYSQVRYLGWSLALLRHIRADFDSRPLDKQVGLFFKHHNYVNQLLDASRKHAAFLEYGTPRGLPKRTVERVENQIEATLLADVEGLTHLQIAQKMGLFVPPSYEIDMVIPQVKDFVRDGRALLERALGEEGWRERAETMRREAERFNSLTENEKEAQLIAEQTGMPIDEVRRLQESRLHFVLDLLRPTIRGYYRYSSR